MPKPPATSQGYFNCLSTAYVCVNGSYDANKLGNASSCASQAICK
jgi:hypothetical protein